MRDNAEKAAYGGTMRFCIVSAVLLCLLLLGLFVNITSGSVDIGAKKVFDMVAERIFSPQTALSGTESRILFSIRIPRMLLAALLGGALAVSGYLLQVFFRNPIAGPFVLGISSGAKMLVGITLIFLSPHIGVLTPMNLIFAAFVGSLMITLAVLLLARRVNSMSMLLVVGIMVGYICSAVTDLCVTFADDHDVVNLSNWSMGSFSGADWGNVKTAAVVCLIGVAGAILLSKPIGAYLLGESYAASMGVNVRRFRVLLILLSSMLSSCVTALAGPVSFVGIAVPHIARSILGSSKPIFVIPSSFLCGAVFCVFCDVIARTLFSPVELAIGTVTSFFGAPVVIYMMIDRRRSGGE